MSSSLDAQSEFGIHLAVASRGMAQVISWPMQAGEAPQVETLYLLRWN